MKKTLLMVISLFSLFLGINTVQSQEREKPCLYLGMTEGDQPVLALKISNEAIRNPKHMPVVACPYYSMKEIVSNNPPCSSLQTLAWQTNGVYIFPLDFQEKKLVIVRLGRLNESGNVTWGLDEEVAYKTQGDLKIPKTGNGILIEKRGQYVMIADPSFNSNQ